MKRARDSNSKDAPEAGPSSSSGRGRSKRSKIQACTSCRRHKTRCEVLDSFVDGVVRCHRCKVLNSTCSYETMDKALFLDQPPSPSPGSSDRSEAFLSNTTGVFTRRPSTSAASLDTVLDDPFPRADIMWSFIPQSLDWSTPMAALQELCKQTAQPPPPPLLLAQDQSIGDILTRHEEEHLLSIFNNKYAPWYSVLVQDGITPFLDLVCCTIASRYLDVATRSGVAPRLQKLTEDKIARMIFNPSMYESLETVQGLIILSLWEPVCGVTQSGGRDGKMLISMAVSMATNMRLNEASTLAAGLRDRTLPNTPRNNALDLETEMNKARLWLVLANTESLLCLGTGRKPMSQRSNADIDLIPIHNNPSSVSQGRDFRLRLAADIFDAAEAGLAIQFTQRADMDEWYTGTSAALAAFDRLSRLALPLSIVQDHDRFYYHMLNVLILSCRQLVLYHAVFQARRVVRDANDKTNPYWFMEIRPHGLNIIVTWGKEILQVAEALLVAVLQADYALVATSPDIVFTQIGLSCGLIVGTKFLVADKLGTDLVGSGERLLELTTQVLNRGSFSADHAPRRCAHVIHSMFTAWQHRKQAGAAPAEEPPASVTPSPVYSTPQSDSPRSQTGHERSYEPVASAYYQGRQLPSMPPDLDPAGYQDEDQSWWSNFFTTSAVPRQSDDGGQGRPT
ncbi:hypothetical protein CYLTODRAFT_488173, partial [Cylindrobasidium torrendii FP15055 ss-10]